jgi:PIN domain nuclease of toxin-antitoxin system
MRLLLDTHTLLWFVEGSSQLPARTRNLLFEEQDDVFVSTASIWEIAIKTSVGKLRFAADIGPFFKTEMARNAFLSLPIAHEHAARVATLPLHHRDPFDRLLVAQCEIERLAIVSRDPSFDAYGIKRLW